MFHMEQLKNNVEVLNVKSVFEDIKMFLEEEVSNDNTRKAYKKDIEDFFWSERKRDLYQLTKDDLKFEYTDILKYRQKVKKHYTKEVDGETIVNHNTVNRKISSMASLYKFFLKMGYDVNANAFNLKGLNGEKTENKTGFMTVEEGFQVVEKAKELPNGEEKSLCLEVLFKSSIRVNDVCDMKWKDIKKHKEQDLYLVKVIGKGGKPDTKPLSNDMYDKLCSLKTENTLQKDKVFSFTKLTAQRAFNEAVEAMGIDRKERKLSIHALKKILGNNELKKGNVVMAARQGNHTLSVMQRHYMEMNEDYTCYPGIVIEKEDRGLDWDQFDKEQLIAALKVAGYESQLDVYGKLQK